MVELRDLSTPVQPSWILLMRNFFLGALTILSVLLTYGGAGAATIYVPGSYASIQAALDAAGADDTVIVKGDEYTENIVIRKPVTLISELGPAKTTVKAAVDGEPVIMIDGAKDVTLSGFTVTGSLVSGILLSKASGAVVTNNRALNNGYGITVLDSHSNTITGNTSSFNSDYGIFLQRSNENVVENNTANSNRDKGFFISYSNRNRIENNNANMNVWNGITIWASNNNIIKGNLTLRNAFGIVIEDSDGNELINNTTLPNIFIILPIFLIYIGILTYGAQKLILRLVYRS